MKPDKCSSTSVGNLLKQGFGGNVPGPSRDPDPHNACVHDWTQSWCGKAAKHLKSQGIDFKHHLIHALR